MRKLLYLALLAAGIACSSNADAKPSVVKVWGGANVVSFDNDSLKGDIEVGATAAASLYHPISVVGSAFVGLDQEYLAGSVGPQISLSDSAATQMSIAVSVERQFSNKVTLRHDEWQAKVKVGFRPWADVPQLVLGAQAAYGIDSNELSYLGALRYRIGGK